MISIKPLVVIFLVALLGGGLGCFFGMRSNASSACPSCCSDKGTDWLHRELNSTASQNAKLDIIDKNFSGRKEQLQAALDEANRKLGETLITERAFTPPVEKSLEMIHHAMADLQKASIEHLFEMKEVLEPEQFEKLLEIAGGTLAN